MTQEYLKKAFKEGKIIERLCYLAFQGKEVWSKVIISNFGDKPEYYRIKSN